jgi:proton-dependent oligopeptide transporter, POT family
MTADSHPRGLYTLFFTEMWERLSYYGMRALLVLFMVGEVQKGGLGLDDKLAAAIYGLYTAGVYLAALPGGWLADRLIGAQRAVWIGGSIIALGHFTLAIPRIESFFFGLVLIVIGTGLLKPNISALVGQLYPEGGARRDAGFTIFYMGINLGALLGPLLCSWLGERINWHYGFVAAGVGMLLGLVQFGCTRHHLGEAGRVPGHRTETAQKDWMLVIGALAILFIVVALAMARVIVLNPLWLAKGAAFVIAGLAVAYFGWVFALGKLDLTEKKRVVVIAILFVTSALFWAGYEQAGSSLNLFAERHTARVIDSLNLTLPAGWFQSVPALFVILFAPVVAVVWVSLARRGLAPSLPAKFGWGLVLLALGFLVVALGSKRALNSGPVWPTWLIATYLFHVLGELLVSPVGLSSVTKLAPPRLVGQMMGIWFLGSSLGNLLAGLFAGEVSGANSTSMPSGFAQVALFTGGAGFVLLLFTKPIRRLMSGVN